MRISAARDGGSARLELVGRLDREWAEHLSTALQDFVGDGVRSLDIDFTGVTYISSAGAEVLAHWQEELSLLRGDVRLVSITPLVQECLAVAGWDSLVQPDAGVGRRSAELRRSSWHSSQSLTAAGHYEISAASPAGTLTCRVLGDATRLQEASLGPAGCSTVGLPGNTFGLGIGAIGGDYADCHEQFGELVTAAGCVAHFPGQGARRPDYLVGAAARPPQAVLASGLLCEGAFSGLIRFSTRPESEAVPITELATTCLDAAGGQVAGIVIIAETAGLCGARLRRSPAVGSSPLRFELPGLRDWLSFASERTGAMTTTLIAGVVARRPPGRLAAQLRPMGRMGRLQGHLHAAVFSYCPLPQRTVELADLLRGIFTGHRLLDVLHLVWDDRAEGAVAESSFARGVGWMAPITQVT
jgi:anti-anti-sigma factor